MERAKDLGDLAVALGRASAWQVRAARSEQERRLREEGRRSFLAEVLVEQRTLTLDELDILLERGRGYRDRGADSDDGPRFGDVAVRKGYVSAKRLYLALVQQRDDALWSWHRLVGEILLDLGWLSPWELEDVLVTLADLASGSSRSGETPSEAFAVGSEAFSGSLLYARREGSPAVAAPSRTSAPRLVREVMEAPLLTSLDSALGDVLDAAFEVEAEAVLVEGAGGLVGIVPVWSLCQNDRSVLVREVLEPGVPKLSAAALVGEATEVLAEDDVPCVAVMSRGKLVGVVTRRSLRHAGVETAALEDEPVYEELGVGD